MNGHIFLSFLLLLLPSTVFALIINFSGGIITKLISEDATDETQLTLMTLSGVTAGQTPTCDLNPSQTEFWVKLDPSTAKYGVYLKAMPNLDFNTKSTYSIVVECTDGVSTTQETFTVNIDKNKSPTISNLHNYTTLDTSTTSTGTLVFTALATDPENDQLTFTMDCYVLSIIATCPYEIFDSGEIVTTSGFLGYSVGSYDLRITVADSHNNQIGPRSLTVTVTGLNTAPVIDNNIQSYVPVVLENSALGSSVYQVTITDPDVGDVHTYSATFTPSTASNYFSIDSSTGLVSTSTTTNIDYDTMSFSSCTAEVTVSDGSASDTKTLTINIANVFEAPSFAKTIYTLSGPEAAAGTSFGTPKYDVTDPDGDSVTYGVDCPTFNINPTTGEVTLSINYDRDDTSVASSVTCGVTVTDGTMTSTAVLEVLIYTINDNTPQFTQNRYEFHISPYDTIGTILGTVTATDADIGSHGVVSYNVRSGAFSGYVGIDTSGNLYLKTAVNDTIAGTTVSIWLRAYDEDLKRTSVYVDFVIQATTTTSITTTTDRNLTFFESSANVAWFSALMIILLGLGIFLAIEAYRSHIFFKICSSCNECKLPKRRKFELDNDLDDSDEYEDRTPSPNPITPVSSTSADLGWSAWNNSDKTQNFSL
ncbi:protocadherin Fat 3-like [Mytilus trossulus]|uniref:protocadherin Fat 3-like n=1 Tax=Mytilus trossulus TaxID=6551 RepID=UPI00300645B7